MNTYIVKVADEANPWHNEHFIIVANNEAQAIEKAERFLGENSVVLVAQARATI